MDRPVMFPPGRARFVTKALPRGSAAVAMTMGMVVVASLAAWIAPATEATITSTFRATDSAASWAARSARPSAHRYSTRMLLPSIYPRSLKALPKGLLEWV